LKRAFTLAEVLITLGIIGVVAGLTLPTLIHNYQNKVLETQFKKSVSLINQFIAQAKLEAEIDIGFAKYCNELPDKIGYLSKTCNSILNKISFGISDDKQYYPIIRNRDIIKTYNSKKIVENVGGAGFGIRHTAPLLNGSYINYNINDGYTFFITVDTNGKKGPNKYGHDIFTFVLDNKDRLSSWGKPANYSDEYINEHFTNSELAKNRSGMPCNLTTTQSANGLGCAYYVLRDECPYDKNKRYFECLP